MPLSVFKIVYSVTEANMKWRVEVPKQDHDSLFKL
jgi:hypothetical protein